MVVRGFENLPDWEKAYIVKRAKEHNPSLPDDFEALMRMPLNKVPLDLVNEILEADIIERDMSLHRMQKSSDTKIPRRSRRKKN